MLYLLMMRSVVMLGLSLSIASIAYGFGDFCVAAEPSAHAICQEQWDRAERIRIEMGLRPRRLTPEERQKRDAEWELPGVRELCLLHRRVSDDEIRMMLREAIQACGGDCRDRLPKEQTR